MVAAKQREPSDRVGEYQIRNINEIRNKTICDRLLNLRLKIQMQNRKKITNIINKGDDNTATTTTSTTTIARKTNKNKTQGTPLWKPKSKIQQQAIRIATLNTKGLRETNKRQRIEAWASKKNIKILAVQETEVPHSAQEGRRDTK